MSNWITLNCFKKFIQTTKKTPFSLFFSDFFRGIKPKRKMKSIITLQQPTMVNSMKKYETNSSIVDNNRLDCNISYTTSEVFEDIFTNTTDPLKAEYFRVGIRLKKDIKGKLYLYRRGLINGTHTLTESNSNPILDFNGVAEIRIIDVISRKVVYSKNINHNFRYDLKEYIDLNSLTYYGNGFTYINFEVRMKLNQSINDIEASRVVTTVNFIAEDLLTYTYKASGRDYFKLKQSSQSDASIKIPLGIDKIALCFTSVYENGGASLIPSFFPITDDAYINIYRNGSLYKTYQLFHNELTNRTDRTFFHLCFLSIDSYDLPKDNASYELKIHIDMSNIGSGDINGIVYYGISKEELTDNVNILAFEE